MFRFNISEEIIFNIKNGIFKEDYLRDNAVINKLVQNIKSNRVCIFTGIHNPLIDKMCSTILYRIFIDYYRIDSDVNVFRVFNIDEIGSLYLEDRFQIFYLYDFFSEISLNSKIYEKYLNRIIECDNKVLIINTRISDVLCKNKFSYLIEDTSLYLSEIEHVLGECSNFDNKLDVHSLYKNLTYIDKLVLFFVFMGITCDINTWIESMEKYLIYRDNTEFRELILNSFKKLEGSFISFNVDKRFYIENPMINDFLRENMKSDKDVIKDLLNNIYFKFDLYNITDILNKNNVSLTYSEYEYETYLKKHLFDMTLNIRMNNVVELFECILNLFKIIKIFDLDIIQELKNKIIYSKVTIDSAIEYLCFINNHREYIISDDVFKNKLLSLIYEYEPSRDSEFYNYKFKYFLFISELYSLYGNIEEEELLDLKDRFNILINIILNNVNSYFTIDYFSLNSEVKQALSDLKEIIHSYNITNIFKVNIYEIIRYIQDKLTDVLNDVREFNPTNVNEYHMLVYFNNELEHNKDFIEDTFDNLSLDNVIHEIRKKIYEFKA